MSDMHLTIRTPDATPYDAPASSVSGASELGALEIFPGHAAMTAVLDFARVVVHREEHQETFLLKQGVWHTDPETNRTEIMAFSCQKLEEFDIKTLREYHDDILKRLQDHESLGVYQVKFLEESRIAVEKQLEQHDAS